MCHTLDEAYTFIVSFYSHPWKVGTITVFFLEKRKQVEWDQVACSARELVDSKNQLNSGCLTQILEL